MVTHMGLTFMRRILSITNTSKAFIFHLVKEEGLWLIVVTMEKPYITFYIMG